MAEVLVVPVPVPEGSKYCHDCKTVKPLGEFPQNHKFGDGKHWRCKECFGRLNRSRAVLPSAGVWPYPTKWCSACSRDVAVEEFSKDSGARYGLGAYCKGCSNERAREFRLRNNSKVLRYARERRKNQEVREARKSSDDRTRLGRGLDLSRLNKLRSYGETEKSFSDLVSEQDGKCAICPKDLVSSPSSLDKMDKAHIDHDHDSDAAGEYSYRGILCGSCNAGLGFFKDSPELLRAAADYIESFRSRKKEP